MRADGKAVVTAAMALGLALALSRGGPLHTAARGAAPLQRHSGTHRVSEPIVIPGAAMGKLRGAPVREIQVWSRGADGWLESSAQVDQRTADGLFAAAEDDDRLDANDELVFMVEGLGDAAAAGDVPPAGPVAATITVADPLQPGWQGVAYVVRTTAPTQAPDLIRFDPTTRELVTAAYTVGLTAADDGFLGVKRLSFAGASRDLVDRSKIRVTIPMLGAFTEETLGVLGGGLLNPVIDGSVRVVLGADGGSVAYPARANLLNFSLGQQVPLIPGLEFRISLDLSPEAAGATYRDALNRSGATIDGAPDTLNGGGGLLLAPWREVSFPEGRLVTLTAGAATPLLVRPYYKDDATPDAADTGDGMSYGDNGVAASSFEALAAAGFLGVMVTVPPSGAPSAEELARDLANPLEVTIELPTKTVLLPSVSS